MGFVTGCFKGWLNLSPVPEIKAAALEEFKRRIGAGFESITHISMKEFY